MQQMLSFSSDYFDVVAIASQPKLGTIALIQRMD